MSIDWQRLARAETHPLRLRLLEAVERAAAPCSPTQLAEEFGEPLSNVSYHLKGLAKAGLIELDHTLIELDHTEPRRGALAHFYRAVA